MKFYNNFQISTNLNSEKIKENLNELIDFDHKKKIGENWIKKSFYGDYISSYRLEIWNKTGIGTGIGDKKNSPKIKIEINAEYLLFEIVDKISPIIRIIFFLVLTAIFILTLIHLVFPFENSDFLYGYVFCAFIGIGYLIRKTSFNSTVKKTKEKFEKILIK